RRSSRPPSPAVKWRRSRSPASRWPVDWGWKMSSEQERDVQNLDALPAEIARRDPQDYAVDGVVPAVALAPTTVEEVSACLAAANDAGLGVIPWGGGSHMGLGNLPASYDVALDLRALD